jgi:pilus assembly protein Flp/PilA
MTRIWRAQSGQGLVEYSLLLVLIAVAAIVALQFIGGGLTADLSSIGSHL